MRRHPFLIMLSLSLIGPATAKGRRDTPPRLPHLEEPVTGRRQVCQRIEHKGYVVGYNEQWLIPLWVAYSLTPEETDGTMKRPTMKFMPDPMVKGRSATHEDYTRQKPYCRGHMVPFADLKWDEEAALESFYLSNVCPQNMSLNSGVWNRLEQHIRKLARQTGDTIYICCGPIVTTGHKTIGANGVAVPARFFKVLCRRHKGQWLAIGFMFDNDECKGNMFDFACSVDEVEQSTGLDFFKLHDSDEEKRMEKTCDKKRW